MFIYIVKFIDMHSFDGISKEAILLICILINNSYDKSTVIAIQTDIILCIINALKLL